MGFLIRHSTTPFKDSHMVFAHSFDSTAGWKASDNSGRETEWESQGLLVQPRSTPILGRAKSLLTTGTRRSRRLAPILATVGVLLSGFVGTVVVILVLGIHPAPDKVTLRKDAAELASLEMQSRMNASFTEVQSLPSPMADNAEIDLVAARPVDLLQSEVPKLTLIPSRASSPEQKRNSNSGTAKKLRGSRRGPEGRLDSARNPRSRRQVAPTQQRYEQKGPNSFLASISRALGFSRN
jgi:hypothetical protein